MESVELNPEDAFSWFEQRKFLNTPPCFLTHWKTNKRFFANDHALLAFEVRGKHHIIAGEAIGESGPAKHKIYEGFKQFSKKKQKNICGYYVGNEWNEEGFLKSSIGTSTSIKLREFDLKTSEAREVRRALKKGLEQNYTLTALEEIGGKRKENLQKLFKEWKKRKLPVKLKFLLSSPLSSSVSNSYEKIFIVEKAGEILAFCSLLPYWKLGKKCFYVDDLIYNPQKDKHALSFLISSLIRYFQELEIEELNLGLNPFANIEEKTFIAKMFKVFYKMPIFYKPKGLHFFKSKFTGTEEPEYFFFQEKKKLRAVVDMASVTLR
ncbi:MAG: phosphatidylglycerol lysyltransferase domain-containing protein [Bdellovibrionales bacterium]